MKHAEAMIMWSDGQPSAAIELLQVALSEPADMSELDLGASRHLYAMYGRALDPKDKIVDQISHTDISVLEARRTEAMGRHDYSSAKTQAWLLLSISPPLSYTFQHNLAALIDAVYKLGETALAEGMAKLCMHHYELLSAFGTAHSVVTEAGFPVSDYSEKLYSKRIWPFDAIRYALESEKPGFWLELLEFVNASDSASPGTAAGYQRTLILLMEYYVQSGSSDKYIHLVEKHPWLLTEDQLPPNILGIDDLT